MSWPSFFDVAASSPGAFLGGGVVAAILEGIFHKPRERQLVEKEKALTEKERALARAVDSGSTVDYVKVLVASNEELLASNRRLVKSHDRIQRSSSRLYQEVTDTKRVLTLLIDVVEQFLDNGGDVTRLKAGLDRARTRDGGPWL